MQLQYDIEFTIATAPQRFAKKWKHTKTTWSHLLERLSKPTVTGETVAEYKAMKKSDRDNRKDIGGFVCGYLKNGQRLKQNVEYRQRKNWMRCAMLWDWISRYGSSMGGGL